MDRQKDTAVEAVLEHLIEHGPDDIATVFGRAFELAMRIERERFLRAGPYERTAERQGYANGYKSKRIDTPAGTVTVDVPKTAGHDGAPFYPQSLERGRRSVRAVMLAVAEMYVKGVSTREVEAVMREFGIESLSSTQVSRVADGDTFTLDCCRQRVRLWGIDAPERDEAAGSAATDALRRLISGKTLTCARRDVDRYGRLVGQCALPDGRDIGSAMLATGTVDEYCRYSGNFYGRC